MEQRQRNPLTLSDKLFVPHEVEMHLRATPTVLSSLPELNTAIEGYLAASVIDRVGGGFPNMLAHLR